MQHAGTGLMRASGDQDVGGSEAVVADAGEIGLRLQRKPFHVQGDRGMGKQREATCDLCVMSADRAENPASSRNGTHTPSSRRSIAVATRSLTAP